VNVRKTGAATLTFSAGSAPIAGLGGRCAARRAFKSRFRLILRLFQYQNSLKPAGCMREQLLN
jgi:hypothetical protein